MEIATGPPWYNISSDIAHNSLYTTEVEKKHIYVIYSTNKQNVS